MHFGKIRLVRLIYLFETVKLCSSVFTVNSYLRILVFFSGSRVLLFIVSTGACALQNNSAQKVSFFRYAHFVGNEKLLQMLPHTLDRNKVES